MKQYVLLVMMVGSLYASDTKDPKDQRTESKMQHPQQPSTSSALVIVAASSTSSEVSSSKVKSSTSLDSGLKRKSPTMDEMGVIQHQSGPVSNPVPRVKSYDSDLKGQSS